MSQSIIDCIAGTIKIVAHDPLTAQSIITEEYCVESALSVLKVPPLVDPSCPTVLTWIGADAMFIIESLWEKIQEKQGISLSLARVYGSFWKGLQQKYSTLQVQKMLPNAIIPSKAHPLDSGFDISVIRVVNPNFGPGVILYGTGLIVRPPDGFYLDMVSRSSLCKLGWMVANCVGVIDAQYRGELCVPLARLNPDAKELELPSRIAQIIIRPLEIVDVEEVEQINSTQRGTGGFGSSGK